MSRLGFYGWVRENVKRAVLLGVSDAVDAMGAHDETEELHPQLASVLQQSAPRLAAAAKRPAQSEARVEGRKRLGRSLNELQPPASAPKAS